MYKPIFTITNNLLSYIAQVEAAKQIIDNAPLVPAWERQFRQEARQRTIYFSTKIEGNKLDFDQTKKVMKGNKVQSFRRRDIQEIINYREVIDYISKFKEHKLDKDLLLKVHDKIMDKILPEDELGKFRKCDEALIDSESGEVVFEPVEPEFIESEIEKLFKWIEKKSGEVHPVVKAGIICYEIVRIHPFTDGNGRAARIYATHSLYSDGYDIKRFFSLEEYYDQNLEKYYKALESVEENDDDLTQWLEFFSKGLAMELDRIKKRVLKMSRDFKLRKDVGQVALSERQIEIINFIQEHEEIRNKDWQELFPDVSDDTILRDLKGLSKKGIVKKEGSTKAARYVMK